MNGRGARQPPRGNTRVRLGTDGHHVFAIPWPACPSARSCSPFRSAVLLRSRTDLLIWAGSTKRWARAHVGKVSVEGLECLHRGVDPFVAVDGTVRDGPRLELVTAGAGERTSHRARPLRVHSPRVVVAPRSVWGTLGVVASSPGGVTREAAALSSTTTSLSGQPSRPHVRSRQPPADEWVPTHRSDQSSPSPGPIPGPSSS